MNYTNGIGLIIVKVILLEILIMIMLSRIPKIKKLLNKHFKTYH